MELTFLFSRSTVWNTLLNYLEDLILFSDIFKCYLNHSILLSTSLSATKHYKFLMSVSFFVHKLIVYCAALSCWFADAFGNQEACGVEQLGTNEYVLELFRGPTASFKDLSSRLLPQFLHFADSTAGDNSRYADFWAKVVKVF